MLQFKKSLIIVSAILSCLFSLASFADTAAGLSFDTPAPPSTTAAPSPVSGRSDATSVSTLEVTTVHPTVTYTEECEDADNIQSIIVFGNGGTWGWKASACKSGYVARALKSYVGMGANSGEWNWRYQCCRTVVKYQ
jgi:hypothetical protein